MASIYFIAFKDTEKRMVPVSYKSQSGKRFIRVFPNLEAARDAAGPLGVGTPQTIESLRKIAEDNGLLVAN